jgi:hypothetical protein
MSELSAADFSTTVEPAADNSALADRGELNGANAAASSGSAPSEAPAALSAYGLAPTANQGTIDGVSAMQSFRAGERGMAGDGVAMRSSFAEEAIRLSAVGSQRFSAQGNGAGAQATVSTRSGGDAWHGSMFARTRQSLWDATNPFSVLERYSAGEVTDTLVKPQDALWEAGGRVGGPLAPQRRNGFTTIAGTRAAPRLFGFAAGQGAWRSFPAQSGPAVPGFFALTAEQVALLGNRGVGTIATMTALRYLDSLMGTVPRTSRQALTFVRLDELADRHDGISLTYARSRLASPGGAGSGASEAVLARGRGSVAQSTIRIDAVTARWLHRFSAHATNDVLAEFVHDDEFEQAGAPLAQEPAISVGGYAPQVSIAEGEFVYGTPAAAIGRQAFPDERRVELADTAQIAVAHHLLSVGGSWSRIDERINDLANVTGTFSYDSGTTGGRDGGLVDWITDDTFGANSYPSGGCPAITAAVHLFCFHSYTQGFGQQQVEFAMHEFAGFAEDRWQLRPHLTVQYGARYEYTLLPRPQQPNAALDGVFSASGETSIFPEDRNNAGTRLSIAWSPGSGERWGTWRLGYGGYFGMLAGATVRAALVNTALASTATHIRITPSTITACPQVSAVGFGYPCAYTSAPPAAVTQTTRADVFAKNFRLPAVQTAQVSWERRLGARALVRVVYDTADAMQLMQTTDVNIAPATGNVRLALQGGDGRIGVRDGETFVVPLYTARLSAAFGPVTAISSHANATYHAGSVQARWAARGWLLQGTYTWSKAIDYGAASSAIPRTNGQFDPYSIGYDKGLANLNVPQRLGAEAGWTARFRGEAVWMHALNGLHLAADSVIESGRPYSYEIFGGSYLRGGGDTINGSGGSEYLPTVGRNTLRMPLRTLVNARLERGWRLGRRANVSAYVQAMNVLNHANVSRVETRAFVVGTAVNGLTPLVFQNAAAITAEGLNQQPFGTPQSSTSGPNAERQMQIGARFNF